MKCLGPIDSSKGKTKKTPKTKHTKSDQQKLLKTRSFVAKNEYITCMNYFYLFTISFPLAVYKNSRPEKVQLVVTCTLINVK